MVCAGPNRWGCLGAGKGGGRRTNRVHECCPLPAASGSHHAGRRRQVPGRVGPAPHPWRGAGVRCALGCAGGTQRTRGPKGAPPYTTGTPALNCPGLSFRNRTAGYRFEGRLPVPRVLVHRRRLSANHRRLAANRRWWTANRLSSPMTVCRLPTAGIFFPAPTAVSGMLPSAIGSPPTAVGDQGGLRRSVRAAPERPPSGGLL